MSTITATPTATPSSLGKTPLLVGIGVVTLVAVSAVVVPRLSFTATTSTPAVSSAPRAGGPDALEAQQRAALARSRSGGLDVAERAGIAARLKSEARLDRLAKTQGNYAGTVAAAAVVPTSVIGQQVGGLHRSYAFTGTTGYSSVLDSQVPRSNGYQAQPSGGERTVWNDRFVPPYDDPSWAEAIERHYFGAHATG
ncbi:hypothetical protein [Longivirga aurantiaca]|uniref:Uncharacterized protein n=1 Tax=Longivirga aurantiaca TaxID=1837743 RepID=A0ABW1SYC2_9ACTN